MNIEILTILLGFSFASVVGGVLLKNILFNFIGGGGLIFLGINMAGPGIEKYYVANDVLMTVHISDVWTGGFGALLILFGIGSLVMMVVDWTGEAYNVR